MSERAWGWTRSLLVLPPAVAAAACGVLVRDFLSFYRGGVADGLFCGGDAGAGCEAVSSHPAALVLGFPLAGWGLLLQLTLLALAIGAVVLRAPERRAVLAAGTGLAGLGVLGALELLRVMWSEIGATCNGCLLVHGLTALSLIGFGVALRAARESSPAPLRWRSLLPGRTGGARGTADEGEHFKSMLKLLGWTVLLGAQGLVVVSTLRPLSELREWGRHEIEEFHRAVRTGEPAVDMARFDGQQWEGPADAELSIVVVGDFECSQCRALERALDTLRAEWPGRLRIAFVNAPLSSRCNPSVPTDLHAQACWLAEAGECAAEQGRFDAYRRAAFEALPRGTEQRPWLAARIADLALDEGAFDACMASGRGGAAVRADIELCRELGLTTTPSIVIEGYVKLGSVHPWMLRELLRPLGGRPEQGAR